MSNATFYTFIAVLLGVPFVTGLLAGWAWGWRGVLACVGTSPIIGISASLILLIVFSQVGDYFGPGPRPSPFRVEMLGPFIQETLVIASAWLVVSIPASIISFAVYTIKNRAASKLAAAIGSPV